MRLEMQACRSESKRMLGRVTLNHRKKTGVCSSADAGRVEKHITRAARGSRRNVHLAIARLLTSTEHASMTHP